ncbi:MAG: GNAT family N-acetyltransferase [Bacteroidales bacterium]|nr:GNAT family N-acetyltransferase [Bacteroidales bacterium]
MTLTVNAAISLKEIDLSDANDIFVTIDSQREYLRKWLPFIDNTKEVTDTRRFIKAMMDTPEKTKEFTFVIHFEGEFAGLIGTKDTDKANKRTEIGYWLSEKFQKRGIITQSVLRLMQFLFDDLGMNRIQIKCATGNFSSKKIPQRLGFCHEGIEHDGELLINDKFTDLDLFSMLKRDFKPYK